MLLSACCDAILLKNILSTLFDRHVKIHLFIDNSAARQLLCRQGTGRIRHMDVRGLWIQLEVQKGAVSVHAVPSKDNISDLGTKRLSHSRMEYLMNLAGSYHVPSESLIGASHFDLKQSNSNIRTVLKSISSQPMVMNHSGKIMLVLLCSTCGGASALGPDQCPVDKLADGYGFWDYALIGCSTYIFLSLVYFFWRVVSFCYGPSAKTPPSTIYMTSTAAHTGEFSTSSTEKFCEPRLSEAAVLKQKGTRREKIYVTQHGVKWHSDSNCKYIAERKRFEYLPCATCVSRSDHIFIR